MNKIKPEDCFELIGKFKGNMEEIVEKERINADDQWFEHLDFKVMLLSNELINKIPTIKKINSIAEVDRIVILSMPAMSTYNWHVDDHRNATVNLLMNNHKNSMCLFGARLDGYKHSFVELNYEPRGFYLFNTKIEHMVINRGPERYILSLQLKSMEKYHTIQKSLLGKTSKFKNI